MKMNLKWKGIYSDVGEKLLCGKELELKNALTINQVEFQKGWYDILSKLILHILEC